VWQRLLIAVVAAVAAVLAVLLVGTTAKINDTPNITTLTTLEEQLFPVPVKPELTCEFHDIQTNFWDGQEAWQLHVRCETNTWGSFEVYNVYEVLGDSSLKFRNGDSYNNSIGIVFATNPVDLYVIFYDMTTGEMADLVLNTTSRVRDCLLVFNCFRP